MMTKSIRHLMLIPLLMVGRIGVSSMPPLAAQEVLADEVPMPGPDDYPEPGNPDDAPPPGNPDEAPAPNPDDAPQPGNPDDAPQPGNPDDAPAPNPDDAPQPM
jgi:preprotein translocase subunit SecD